MTMDALNLPLHFMRPLALWFLCALPVMWWFLRRRHHEQDPWAGRIDPHLRPYVLEGSARTGRAAYWPWLAAVTIAVLGVQGSDSAASVRLITVTGASTNVSSISQADSIAAGQGPRNLFLATADGRLMANVSLRWEEIATGLSDPAFPG